MKTTLNFSIKSISNQLRMVVLASAFLLSGILFNAFAQTPAFYNSSAGTTYNAFPINSTTSNKVQWLYGPSLFNSAGSTGTPATSGVISKVYFRLGTTVSSTSSYSDYTISLGQNVGTTTAWSSGTFTTGLTQCFYQSTFSMTGATATSWYAITLQTPFSYDPSKSLVFELKVSAGTGNQVAQTGSTNQRIYAAYSATSGTAGTGLVDFGFDLAASPNDVGISALVNPNSICGAASDPFIVQIKNNGNNALSTGLGIPITMVLSGVSSGTYTKNFNRALSLGASDTIHMTTINTSGLKGLMNIKSWAAYSADTVHNNDTNLTKLTFIGTPATQPTALTLKTVSNNQVDGSFTAASGAPNGYLVVGYLSGASPTAPSNGITYSPGNSLGSGIVVQSGAATSFSAPGLTPTTAYDFYIYSMHTCSSGPFYYTVTPLKGSITTKALPATADNYQFEHSTGSTLDSMNGATVLLTSSNDDTPSATSTNIGFNFEFEEKTYTNFFVAPDGWLKLGGSSATSSFTNGIASTTISNAPLLCAFWDDLATGTTGSVKYLVTGSSPNRILKVQWFVTIPRLTTAAANSLFQIWLYETSNRIEYRYGFIGTAASTASVGIRGADISPAKFISLTLNPLSLSTASANDGITTQPAEGHMYSFAPAVTCTGAPSSQPTSLSLSTVVGSSSKIKGSFTAASGNPNSYLVVAYPKDSAVTHPTSGNYYFRGASLGKGKVVSLGRTTSFIAEELKDTTPYDFYIYSADLCNSGPLYYTSNPLKGTLSTRAVIQFVSTSVGGLWSSPATWQGGMVPVPSEAAVIADGATVTIDQLVVIKNLIVGQGNSGILQWNNITNAMNVLNDLTIRAGAKFLPYNTGSTGQTVNIGGNFTNNGYANLAVATTLINFNGSQVGGSMNQVLSGTGEFQGNGSYGIIRSLFFQTTGTSTISTSQALATSSFGATAGTLNTNGKLTIDNTLAVYGQTLNLQVASVAVTNMGVAYSNAPIVFGATATAWSASGTGTSDVRYFSGSNVYLATTTGTFSSSTSPSHTSGITTNGTVDLLWIGTTGTLGNPFQKTAVTRGTQYFYGNNLYVCSVAGTPSATAPPTHTTGTASSGTATFLYVGNPANVSVNYQSSTQTVRSLTINSAGYGYSAVPSLVFITNGGTVTTTAAASVVFFQQIIGPTNSLTQKSGSATISGGLNINSTQGASAYSGVGALTTSNGGVYYTVAPTVGFTGPTGINLVTNPGSGYTTNPTISLSGGTLVSGTALTTSSFTITVNQGQVVSVYLTTPGTACYSVPPTLSFSSGSATLEFPSGCWPAATASIGSNGQLTDFSVTNSGFGYVVAPTVGVGTTSGTSTGGTFASVATAPISRVALYNVTYNNFTPSPVVMANTEGAEIPSTRKLNNLTLGSPGIGANFYGDIEVFGTAPLTLTSGVLDMNGSNLLCTWNGYAGATGTLTNHLKNGSMTLTTRGGGTTGSTLNFPFSGTLTAFTGTGTASTGASVLTLTASQTGAPSGGANGKRAFRVISNSGSVYGTNPTVTLNWNTVDSLVSDQAGLFVAQSASLSGSWTVRSVTSGTANLSLGATGSRSTGTTSPGPIVPTGDDYFAWFTTYSPPSPLNYKISRTTGNTYNSIINTGNTLGWTSTSTDDNISPAISIPSSTFMYQGDTVKGFNLSTNGFIKLITNRSASTTSSSLTNVFGGGTIPLVVAPFWEDLTTNPSSGIIAKLDSSSRYQIIGSTAGSRKIVCEWADFKALTGPAGKLNFQVVLDESDNSITFNYGKIQGFNGTGNFIYSYSCGLGGLLVNGNPNPGQALAMQYENSTAFSHNFVQTGNAGSNALKILPEANSSIKFTPGTYAGFSPPAATAPSNDEATGAIALTTFTSVPNHLSGTYYSSRFATASSTSVCGGLADDDVWFKFKATQKKSTVRIYGSGGYVPRVQVLNSSLNLLSPSQCAVASAAGTFVDATATGLTPGQMYYIRVYHDGGGIQATATANITSAGLVSSANITNPGSGYTAAASGSITTARVRFSGGGGNDAVGSAVITNGLVSGITITSGGYGYTSSPNISIESPNWAHTGEFAVVVISKSENDDCATATELTDLTTFGCNNGSNSLTDNTVSATQSSQAVACGTPDDDVWYKFTAVNALTKISVSATGLFNPAFQIFDGGVTPGNCNSLTSLQCVNAAGAGQTDTALISTTMGNTYYVRVYHADTGTVIDQNFTICVSSGLPLCINTPLTPSVSSTVCAGDVKLSWAAAPTAIAYDVYLNSGNGPATTLISANQTATSLSVPLTAANYSWRVVPINIFGKALSCQDFKFTAARLVKPSFTNTDTCAGGSVKFTSTSTVAGGTITNNAWRFGDGSNGSGNSTTHAYSGAGVSYNVKIISTSNTGCVDSAVRSITILSTLIAGSISADQSICYNTTPSLIAGNASASGSKGPYLFQWQVSTDNINFTNIGGATSTDYQPGALTVNTFYRRAVTTTSGCGPAYTNTVKITTNAPLTAGSIGSKQTICFNGTGSALKFNTTPTGAFGTYTYQWQQSPDSSTWSNVFGQTGSTFTPTNVTKVTYYQVLVTSGACPSANTNGVKIELYSPITGGAIAAGQTLCAGTTPAAFTQVTAPSGGPGTYAFQWQSSTDSINWNNISGANSATYASPAVSTLTYFQRLAGSTGCPDGISNALKIRTLPKPNVVFGASDHCYNDPMPLTNSSNISSGSLSYQWKFGDGTTSTSSVPNKTYASSGTYVVSLKATSGLGCKDSSSKTVIVATSPSANYSFTLKCQGDSVIFSDQTVYACGSTGGVVYSWNFGDGNTSSTRNARHHYKSSGTYNVKFKISLSGGFKDSVTKVVSFNIRSTPDFSISNTCAPAANTITNASSNFATLAWTFGDGSSSNTTASSFTKTYASAGTYNVKLVSTSSFGCKDSLTKQVSLFSKPTASFSTSNSCVGSTTTFNNSSSGASGYVWDFGNGTTSTQVNPSLIYASAGTYTIKLKVTTSNGCIDSTTGSVTIYPNPTASFTTTNVCLGFTSSFTNTSTGANSYKWDFGNGNTSTASNPTYTYPTAGNYSIKLIATTSNGCSHTATGSNTVYPSPSASFNGANVCLGNSVNFSNTSTGASSSNWNFGDATTSTLTNPSKVYASSGTFDVKLKVLSSFGCADSITQKITIYAKPTAAFSASNQCFGNAVSFNNQSSGANTNLWSFGDGNSSAASSPNYNYAAAGTYTVKLAIASVNNCKDSITKTVTVYPKPSVSFTASPNPICRGGLMSFTNTSTNGASYLWNFGNGSTSTLTSPTNIYNTAGNYNVKLVSVSSNGCKDSTFRSITIWPRPVASFSVNNGCETDNLAFTSNSVGAITHAWTFGDGNTSTATNPSKGYTAAGTYNVKLIVTSLNGCMDTTNSNVSIYPRAKVSFTNASSFCVGATANFTNTSSLASGNMTFQWKFGDGNTSASTNSSNVYSNPGNYTVTLTANTDKGCINTSSANVLINAKPLANFNASNVCQGQAVTFNNTSVGGLSYSWNFGDAGTSTAASPSYTYAAAGTYTVTLTATNANGCVDVFSKQLTIFSNPVANFTATDRCIGTPTLFTNTSTA
jgi:PKD repeat protein